MSMKNYENILNALEYPLAANISDSRVAEMFIVHETPAYWYGFPPALIPIASDGTWPLYFGLWKHWFVPRQASFVELNVNLDCQLEEIARTDKQFATLTLVRLIVAQVGITDQVRWLAARLGFDEADLARFDAHTPEHADFPEELTLLPEFADHPPLFSVEDGPYDGEFPQGNMPEYSSYFEYDPEILAKIPDPKPWLDPESDKPALFETYLVQSDFGAAWLTLNGTGWQFRTAASALRRLADAAPSDPVFLEIVKEWCAFAAEDDGAY